MDEPRVRSVPPLPAFRVDDIVLCLDPSTREVVEGRIRGFLGDYASVETAYGWIYVPVRSLRDVPAPLER